MIYVYIYIYIYIYIYCIYQVLIYFVYDMISNDVNAKDAMTYYNINTGTYGERHRIVQKCYHVDGYDVQN